MHQKTKKEKEGAGGGGREIEEEKHKRGEWENKTNKKTKERTTYAEYAPARTLTAKWQFVYSEERTYSNSRTHKNIRRFADVRRRTYNSCSRKNVSQLRTLIRIPIRIDGRPYFNCVRLYIFQFA
jgi:hypothetical protein